LAYLFTNFGSLLVHCAPFFARSFVVSIAGSAGQNLYIAFHSAALAYLSANLFTDLARFVPYIAIRGGRYSTGYQEAPDTEMYVSHNPYLRSGLTKDNAIRRLRN
jgi:hypothetical protein